MDSVPYAFCANVSSTISEIRKFAEQCRHAPDLWAMAAGEHAKKRVVIVTCVSYSDNSWTYSILKLKTVPNDGDNWDRLTLDQLKSFDKGNVHVTGAYFGKVYRGYKKASFDQISEIIRYVYPVLNNAYTEITPLVKGFPEDALSELLSIFQDSSVSEIYLQTFTYVTKQFLKAQLQSGSVKSLILPVVDCPKDLRPAVESFVLGPHDMFVAPMFKFSMAFFKKLFKKRIEGETYNFHRRFDFNFNDLRNFSKDLQISARKFEIQWKRKDGVKVTATKDRSAKCERWRIAFNRS